ncbi:hypothetical protein BES34_014125 [Leptospira inadai serovar Lyme]|uniref:Uncharacterized protein n=1 Tax=Leptospira inadai serovar Lyme TaxID=293084 RepID=A0ABX4YGD0_9LEPT|nr:hypothetical protein BES34_014125 [Leptospira inadai serovar Lyme]
MLVAELPRELVPMPIIPPLILPVARLEPEERLVLRNAIVPAPLERALLSGIEPFIIPLILQLLQRKHNALGMLLGQ